MALQCTVYPCVRTYRANVDQTKPTDTLVSTERMQKPELAPLQPFIATPMPCLLNGTYYNATTFTEHNATNPIPVNGLLPDNQTAYLPKECYFSYDNPLGISKYLPVFLAGYADRAPEDDLADPPWVGQLYNNASATLGTVNATWASLAECMTVRIRQAGDDSNSAPASGDTWHTDTCISVQWPWLAFPVTLVVLATAFLLATIVQGARRSWEQIWKSSPLALLFHGLDNDLRDRYKALGTEDDMEQTAKKLSVQFETGNGPSRLVEAFKATKG